MHFLLFYELTSDYAERRVELRNEHLALAWQAYQKDELVLGGVLADPIDQAILLFKGETAEVAEKFAVSDPYVLNGLVTKWYVRPWTTVVGETAFSPVRPI